MKKTFFVLAAIIIGSPLIAQQDTTILSLDEVVMTANKYPNKTSLTGKVVTIITRDQLEKSGGKTLAQILTEQSALYINGANSNPGKDKAVFLRGARTEHTLITIDGVPVYDASGTGNHFDIRNMPVDNIERIEILKGSQSTLYGSDAIAGVINIITRRQVTDAFNANALLSYGSFNTIRANAGLGGKIGILDYNASYTYNKSDGINETLSDDVISDKDGYEQNGLQAAFGLQLGKYVRVQPYVRFSKLKGEFDQGAFVDEMDYSFEQKSYQAGIRNELQLGKVKLNVIYNFNSIDRLYVDDSTESRNGYDIYSRGSYEGQEHFIDAYAVIPVSRLSKLTVGADFRRSTSDQQYYSLGFFGPFSTKYSNDSLKQRQVAVYSAFDVRAEKGFGMEVGHRVNFHSEYGSNYVFNFNPYYLLKNRFKFFANVSSGFRTPSLYQLFSEYGNRDLKPETSISGEVGVQYYGKLNGRITGFVRNVKDVIFFFFNPTTFQSQYINQDEQKDHGAEVELSYNMNKLMLRAAYTYIDGKIKTIVGGKDTTYNNLIRRPKHSLNVNAGFQVMEKFFVSTNLLAVGKRKDTYFDPQTFSTVDVDLKSYVLLDLYAEYGLKKKIKFFGAVRNLLDQDFQEVAGFNTMGINWSAGLRWVLD